MTNLKPKRSPKRGKEKKVDATRQQSLFDEWFAEDYQRFLLALQNASVGELFFIQINSPVKRRTLIDKLHADGLKRLYHTANFPQLPPGLPPHIILRKFLEDSSNCEILFVDGLEHFIGAKPKPGGALEALNLGREALAELGVVVVFLLPLYLINLIRSHAHNLWTWRAHHYCLDPIELAAEIGETISSLDTGQTITPGDTPESRNRRIRILHRLLDDGLAENRTIDSLIHSVILPLANDLHDAGELNKALEVVNKTLDSSNLAEDSPERLELKNLKAMILLDIGKDDEAEILLEQILAARIETLGRQHPGIAPNLNNLACLYHRKNKYEKAELLFLQALEMDENLHGKEYFGRSSTLNNLALLYVKQSRYEEAESLHLQALEIRKKILPEEHPQVAQSLANLASVFVRQGRYKDAELLYVPALEMNKKLLGPEHPDVAMILNNLGALYVYQGRFIEAEPLLVQALQTQERLLGPNQPDTINTKANLKNLRKGMKQKS